MNEHRQMQSDVSDKSDSFDIVAVIRSYMERAKSDMSDSRPTSPTTSRAGRTEFYQQKQCCPTCPTGPTRVGYNGVARTSEAIKAEWQSKSIEDRSRDTTHKPKQIPEVSARAPRDRELPTQPPLCCVCRIADWQVALTQPNGRKLHVHCAQSVGSL